LRARGFNWAGSRLGWAERAGDARTRGRDEGLPADFNEKGRDAKQGWDRGDCELRCWAGKGGWLLLLLFFAISFLKQANKFEFKPGLNPNTPKQCTGMNATHIKPQI
jgi:hypothetical protein